MKVLLPSYTINATYRHLIGLPIGEPRCVYVINGGQEYRVVLPKKDDKRQVKSFFKSRYGAKAYSTAVKWMLKTGAETWGEEHFCKYVLHHFRVMAFPFGKVDAASLPPRKWHYGVTSLGGGSYRGSFKTTSGKQKGKTFSYSKFGEASFEKAAEFVDIEGAKEWGVVRFSKIKAGQSYRITSKTKGVSVNLRKNTYELANGGIVEYLLWTVAWREDPSLPELAETFNPSHYGGMEQAQRAAEWFAVKLRASRCHSQLNLPESIVRRLELGLTE